MKKIIRKPGFELNLHLKDEDFINPPQFTQKNTILNQMMKEFSMDVLAMDEHTKAFSKALISGNFEDRTQLTLSDHEIMEDWQTPMMKTMARYVGETKGDVLEIGFGRGVSSSFIQDYPLKSHTIIECNHSIVDRFHEWKKQFKGRDIRIVEGLWQDTIEDLDLFDAIFFHTYPLNDEEYMNYVHGGITFAGHFFEHAAAHLKKGGVFTYLTTEIDSLSRAHQRLLFKFFKSFSLETVAIDIPPSVRDAFWSNTMVAVKAVK